MHVGFVTFNINWPTPVYFVDELIGDNIAEDALPNLAKAILVVLSTSDCFDELSSHITATRSYILGCRLLRVGGRLITPPGYTWVGH